MQLVQAELSGISKYLKECGEKSKLDLLILKVRPF